jgi:hypothetical protein
MATFYRQVAPRRYTRASVLMQPSAGPLKHSVISYRLAREREVRSGRRSRRRWTKN